MQIDTPMRRWMHQAGHVARAIYSGRTANAGRLLLGVAAAFCTIVGLYDLLTITLFLSGGPLIGPQRWVLFPDFLVFHAAARAFFEGNLSIVYDFSAFVAYENRIYVDRFPSPVGFRPFLYPPVWLLLILPVALLAVAAAYGAFMAVTVAISYVLIGRSDLYGWLAVITSPAALWTMISGQNTFLTIGLFYGGMGLLTRSPVAAGILLGILSYKPQLWILVPVALVAGRHWRALVSTIGTALVLALLSLLVFGFDFWIRFFEMAREASSPEIVNMMFRDVSIYMTTILAAARILGVAPDIAGLLHVVGALAGCALVWFGFRRYPHSDERTAVLAAGTLLLTPYLVNYDMLLLSQLRHAAADAGGGCDLPSSDDIANLSARTPVLLLPLARSERRCSLQYLPVALVPDLRRRFRLPGFRHLEGSEPGDVALLALQGVAEIPAISCESPATDERPGATD